jgi:uncharacterized membrane protein
MTARGSQSTRAPSQARNNIEAILRFEKEDEKELALHHRIFHAIGWFFGTTHFLSAQCLAVCLCIALNSLLASSSSHRPLSFSAACDVSVAGGRAVDLLRADPAKRHRSYL